MRTLIIYASRYGSTKEIAAYIGKVLGQQDLEVDILSVEQVKSLHPYKTVILGSAVYAGNWLTEARRFVDKFEPELAKRRVWLFSSGPVGKDADLKTKESVKAEDIIKKTKALEHQVFAGKIDPDRLNIAWRAIMHSMGAVGDFRDWNDIEDWSLKIATAEKNVKTAAAQESSALPLHKY